MLNDAFIYVRFVLLLILAIYDVTNISIYVYVRLKERKRSMNQKPSITLYLRYGTYKNSQNSKRLQYEIRVMTHTILTTTPCGY